MDTMQTDDDALTSAIANSTDICGGANMSDSDEESRPPGNHLVREWIESATECKLTRTDYSWSHLSDVYIMKTEHEHLGVMLVNSC